MQDQRQCPRCGRQFSNEFQFCPFDATPLSKRCPACGRTWEPSFQFCPFDSTPLAEAVAPGEPAAPPASAAASQPSRPALAEGPATAAAAREQIAPASGRSPSPSAFSGEAPPSGSGQRSPAGTPANAYGPKPTAFTFADQVAKPSWKTVLFRPATMLFAAGAVLVGFFVWYLNARTGGPDLPPPTVSYKLLPNEGKTKGVPVAIKVNQLTVFLIDDPMEDGGASRSKEVVANLNEVIQPLKAGAEVRFAVQTVNGRPAIVEVSQEGVQPKTLVSVTEGDEALAGETDANRVAAQWAERLTDAVKVFVFGEAPTFSTGTEFGDSLLAMYKVAAAETRGKVSKKALDQAYQRLPAAQREALEAPPLARKQHAGRPSTLRKAG